MRNLNRLFVLVALAAALLFSITSKASGNEKVCGRVEVNNCKEAREVKNDGTLGEVQRDVQCESLYTKGIMPNSFSTCMPNKTGMKAYESHVCFKGVFCRK